MAGDGGGHQAAPDRPRDLHPLQHLRGDLPGRRDHARRSQLRRARRRLQLLHGLHLAVPDRLDRQLAHDAAGARLRDRGAAQLGRAAARADAGAARGRRRRPMRGERGRRAGARRHARRPPAARRRSTRAAFGATVPPWSAAHAVHQPVRRRRAPTTATVVGNVNCTEAGFDNQTHHIVLDFGAMPFPVLEGQSIGIVPPGVDARRPAAHRAPVLDREPAQRRAARLQQRLADGQARDRGPPGPAGARRRSNYLCDLKVGDTVQVIGPVRQSLPDAEPPEVAHRDDLHRHRQRADARDDRMAPAPAQERQVRGRQADAVLRRAHAARSCRTSARCRACRRTSSTSTSRSRARRAQPKRYVQDLMRERAADLARAAGATRTPTSTSAA